MSTSLQRAEELKSLISQYQAELSDIYSEIHSSEYIKDKPQRIGLLTEELFSRNANIDKVMDDNVLPIIVGLGYYDDFILTQYNYKNTIVDNKQIRYNYNDDGNKWRVSNYFGRGNSTKNSRTYGYGSGALNIHFYPVMFV